MRTLISNIGAIIFFVVLIAVLIIGGFYLKKSVEHPLVDKVVQTFFADMENGSVDSANKLLAPSFMDSYPTFITDNGATLAATKILQETDNGTYNFSGAAGETFVYNGLITDENGNRSNMIVNLQKIAGQWYITGLTLDPVKDPFGTPQ